MGSLPKGAIKTSHLLNRGALGPSNLRAHTITLSRFFGAVEKQLSGITQVQLTSLCSPAVLDKKFPTCALWEWLQSRQTGQGKTYMGISTHMPNEHITEKVIPKCLKFQLIFTGYKSISCCDSPTQDSLVILFRRGSLDLKWWRSTGLAHLLRLCKS